MIQPEIECRQCDGNGRIATEVHPAMQCQACAGEGWRPMTQDEIDDAAADAFSDMCEGEPPISFEERYQMAARAKAGAQ